MLIKDETQLVELKRSLKKKHDKEYFLGKCEAIRKAKTLIKDLAEIKTTVLVTGESGTGKELVLEALHHNGDRRNKPLVKVNCAALSENLLESELFGHVKGAFTGAFKDKIGRFQRADGGTLFLDEIGDISPRMQLRLLRALESMEFERVGDSTPIKVDVRIVAATNQILPNKVADGQFRQDLYYRLKVVEIHLPPLRERKDDIPLLANHFLVQFNTKFNKNIKGLSSDTWKAFLHYSWPGNVRELENTRNRLLSRKQIIESLQASRSLTVELLDKLAKTIPVGITLTNVRQQGSNLVLLGTSQSNARVSAYLQSLDEMDLFVRPELQYVRAAERPASRVEPYEFAISVRLDNTAKEADEETGDEPAGA